MLGGAKLTIGYSRERNCFAYISSKYSTNNEQSQSVQIILKGRKIILWVIFSNGVKDGTLLINPIYCRLLDLAEGMEVYVSPQADLKILNELFVEPDSPDDQEILEQNAEILQMNILDQLKVVVTNQKAIVWISVSLPIIFTPKQTGLLVNHSSIIVKMDAFLNSPRIPVLPSKKTESSQNTHQINNVGMILDGLLQPFYNAPKTKVLRALPISSNQEDNCVHPYKILMHEELIPFKEDKTKPLIATLELIPSIIDSKQNSEEDESTNSEFNKLCVEVIPIDTTEYWSLTKEDYDKLIPTAIIPQSLNEILSLDSGQKVIVTFVPNEFENAEEVKIIFSKDSASNQDDVSNKFKQVIVESSNIGSTFIINHNVPVLHKQLSSDLVVFKLKSEKLKFVVLNSEMLRNCSVITKCSENQAKLPIRKNPKSDDYESKNYCRSVENAEELVGKVILHLNFEIRREVQFKGVSEIKGNVLITGSSGSGKSSLCDMVANDITFWSYKLNCRSLRGRKDIPDILAKAVLTCQEHSPSVLICDNVDALVPADTEGGAPQDIAYYDRLAVVIKHMLRTCSGVCVLLTATSVKSLHPTLREFRAKPLFTAHFEIKELTQPDRLEFLKHLVNENLCSDFSVDEEILTMMAIETSGQNYRDIVEYVNRRIYVAVKKKYAEKSEDLPRLMGEGTIEKKTEANFDIWGPLGGLHEAKQQLTESIFWPMMYPGLFPSQSCGILLFGPPGTGKSYIGSCLARLHDMHFMSVKGPELLSKYIGQSEKAVRDIFDKADMKRPCILFFDEFDSLAPKRGHDSTGVTDRVVNQLLVRLDGAEGGARGPVVAATSRPDLVDPALLRPGRLDRHVYCPLPDLKGREEVLRTLSSSVNVDATVDLKELATRTEGFSPADLKALLVTAQLTALDNKISAGGDTETDFVSVGQEEIESALLETKPSLSMQQRLFYQTINKRFRGERLSDEEIVQLQGSQRQRVTLA